MSSLDNVRKNIVRICELCEERDIPINYAPLVDPYYAVIYPGTPGQFILKQGVLLEEIPSVVFAELTSCPL